jgi:TetR/AcrR family transcriptional regulator
LRASIRSIAMSPQFAASRPVRRRRSGLRTRAEIVAAAERHFAERGFEATRLEDVATEVGIRRAAIFYHFGDKQELYAEVLDEVFRDWTSVLPTDGSAAERLEASLIGWIDYVARRPTVARMILREIANARPGNVATFERAAASLEWFRAVIDAWSRVELDKHKREILLVARGMLGIRTDAGIHEAPST